VGKDEAINFFAGTLVRTPENEPYIAEFLSQYILGAEMISLSVRGTAKIDLGLGRSEENAADIYVAWYLPGIDGSFPFPFPFPSHSHLSLANKLNEHRRGIDSEHLRPNRRNSAYQAHPWSRGKDVQSPPLPGHSPSGPIRCLRWPSLQPNPWQGR